MKIVMNPAIHNSVRAAGGTPLFACRWDADWDGDKDLIMLFQTQHFNLTENSTELTLIGQTHNGELIHGTDVIKIVPQQKRRWCPPRTQRKHRRK